MDTENATQELKQRLQSRLDAVKSANASAAAREELSAELSQARGATSSWLDRIDAWRKHYAPLIQQIASADISSAHRAGEAPPAVAAAELLLADLWRCEKSFKELYKLTEVLERNPSRKVGDPATIRATRAAAVALAEGILTRLEQLAGGGA